MSHISEARYWQDQVVICRLTVLADLRLVIRRGAYGDHTAGTVPAESWFCKLSEHVFNCSITSCQIVESRLANSEDLMDYYMHGVPNWQNSSCFASQKNDRSYCSISHGPFECFCWHSSL
jgi:hypothetical protein